MSEHQTRCGFVAIVGRPNVGKSTLLNRLLGQKISITSRKPQTTRQRLLGIQTLPTTQLIYIDTPGIQERPRRALNRSMDRAVKGALVDVDVILFMVEANLWRREDEYVWQCLQDQTVPIIVLINKIDCLADRNLLLPQIEKLHQTVQCREIIPISAKKNIGLDKLPQLLAPYLPESPFLFGSDAVTDKSVRFLLAEFVREKLFRGTGQELPYSLTVEIEAMQVVKNIYHIHALIIVETRGQKRIVIGEGGEKLKAIGTTARLDMERMLDKKVFLQLWVKVKSGWADDDRALYEFGYTD